MAVLKDLVSYTDGYLRIGEIHDWPNALNGLQVENDGALTKIGAAVDASGATLREAAARKIDLLIVHHGLFWPGLQRVSGALFRQLKVAIEKNIAVYSAHLPLDLHPEVGNNMELSRALGFENPQPFLEIRARALGLRIAVTLTRADLIARLEKSLGQPVQCIGAGPKETTNVGIITGGAGSEIYAVAREGIDTFITGEAPHWGAVAAEELGINLLLGGHYATETFGVKALAAHLAERFRVPWEFIDHPTGL